MVVADVIAGPGRRAACIVDQNVNRQTLAFQLRAKLGDILGTAQVGLKPVHLHIGVGGLNLRDGGLKAFGIPCTDHDIGAFGGQTKRNGFAQAVAGGRHQGALSLYP